MSEEIVNNIEKDVTTSIPASTTGGALPAKVSDASKASAEEAPKKFVPQLRTEKPFNNGQKRDFNRNNNSRNAGSAGGRRNDRTRRPKKEPVQDDLITQVIDVRRVTRVVRGGKRMRFAALVVVGDGKGKIGYGFRKGMDFQDSVAKATKNAKQNLFSVKIDENKSLAFPLQIKNKSCRMFIKPAPIGTGLIAGGYLRPVLELVGVENIFTKIIGSNNKILGVQTTMKALQKLSNY